MPPSPPDGSHADSKFLILTKSLHFLIWGEFGNSCQALVWGVGSLFRVLVIRGESAPFQGRSKEDPS